jgi:hypothetical protein
MNSTSTEQRRNFELAKRSPLFHYNTYVRKENEPYLSQSEFLQMQQLKRESHNRTTTTSTERSSKAAFLYVLIDE